MQSQGQPGSLAQPSLRSLRFLHCWLCRFGAFAPRFRPARKARNPKTQEELDVEATTVPTFTASKVFKDKVGKGNNGTLAV